MGTHKQPETPNKPTTEGRGYRECDSPAFLMRIHPLDFKMVKPDPDPDFSEERNRQIVEEAIAATDRIQKRKRKEFDEQVAERTSAAAQFIERVKMGRGSSDVKSYFGKKMLDYLSGKEARKLEDITVIDDGSKQI